jgi:hypothetical protein
MTAGETKLIFPGLAGFYASWRDIAYTLVRVIIGYIVFMHGWAKVTGAGVAGVSALMARQGLEQVLIPANTVKCYRRAARCVERNAGPRPCRG